MAERKLKVAFVHVYRDQEGEVRYRAHAKNGKVVEESDGVFDTREDAAGWAEQQYPGVRISHSPFKSEQR